MPPKIENGGTRGAIFTTGAPVEAEPPEEEAEPDVAPDPNTASEFEPDAAPEPLLPLETFPTVLPFPTDEESEPPEAPTLDPLPAPVEFEASPEDAAPAPLEFAFPLLDDRPPLFAPLFPPAAALLPPDGSLLEEEPLPAPDAEESLPFDAESPFDTESPLATPPLPGLLG